MTKQELLEALQPYTDDIEIVIAADGRFFEIDHAGYGTNSRQDGVALLTKGAQMLVPKVFSSSNLVKP